LHKENHDRIEIFVDSEMIDFYNFQEEMLKNPEH